jgi:hypothetical protein
MEKTKGKLTSYVCFLVGKNEGVFGKRREETGFFSILVL